MAFDPKNLVRISAGEVASDQLGGNIDFCYESATDDTGTGAGEQGGPDYFNDIYQLVRYGSIIKCIYKEPNFVNFSHELYWVDSNNPTENIVTLGPVHTPSPSPFYEIVGEAPLSYTTSGGNTDIVPFPSSQVGFFATYSLNSGINDIGPPIAHSGIEFIECQAGQLLIDYSRPVVAGQTVLLWVQIRTAAPSP